MQLSKLQTVSAIKHIFIHPRIQNIIKPNHITHSISRQNYSTRQPNYGWENLDLDEKFEIPALSSPLPTENRLCCTLRLSSYHPAHLDFLAYFARHAASALSLPTHPVIHTPAEIKKWNVIRSPFIHAKTRDIFEKKTYYRIIQAVDGDDEVVKRWIAYIHGCLPHGVDMTVDRYEWRKTPASIELDHQLELSLKKLNENLIQKEKET